MLYVQKYLQNNSLDDLKNDFDIKHTIKDDLVCLKYGIKSPKYNPIVIECRGIVLSLPDYNVIARPFDRFFNLYEGDDYKKFDWSNAIIMNKLDGSLIKVYYHNKWYCGTSGTVDASGNVGIENDKTFKELFEESIGGSIQEKFKNLPKDKTYLFELTSPENRIVSRYKKTKSTLLAVRNNKNGKYINTHSLNFCDTVEQYNIPKSFDKIVEFVESRNQFDEGCVLYDYKNNIRIKVKNSSYVILHHLKGDGLTKKSIISLIIKNEIDEYLAYFPEDTYIIKPYIDKYNDLIYNINNVYDKYKDIIDQKEFAMNVKHLPYSSFLFQLRRGKTLKELLSIDNINIILRNI